MDFPIAFFNGQHLPKEKICISPDDRGFLFGDGTYEVILIYHGKPFRLTRHIERLRYSTEAIRLPFSNFKQIEELAYTLIQKNNLQNGEAMLYIQITRGVATRSHAFPFETFPTVYASLFPVLDYSKQRKEGVGVILVPDLRWQKCNIKSISLDWPMYWPVKKPLNSMPMKPFLCEKAMLPKEPIRMCAQYLME